MSPTPASSRSSSSAPSSVGVPPPMNTVLAGLSPISARADRAPAAPPRRTHAAAHDPRDVGVEVAVAAARGAERHVDVDAEGRLGILHTPKDDGRRQITPGLTCDQKVTYYPWHGRGVQGARGSDSAQPARPAVRAGRTDAERAGGRVDMTRFGVMKHLGVLEEAGLGVRRRPGQREAALPDAVPIRLVHDRWVSKYAEPWAATLSGLKTHLEDDTMETVKTVSWADGTAPVAAGTAVFEVFIKTTPERLWEAITDPAERAKYSFGVEVDSGLVEGLHLPRRVPGVVPCSRNERRGRPAVAAGPDVRRAVERRRERPGTTRLHGTSSRLHLMPADGHPRPAAAERERPSSTGLADDPVGSEDAARDRRTTRHSRVTDVFAAGRLTR